MHYQPIVLGDAATVYAAALQEDAHIKVDNRQYAIAAHAFLAAEGINVARVPTVAPATHQTAVDLFADGYRAVSP
jgi:hypothetical protein